MAEKKEKIKRKHGTNRKRFWTLYTGMIRKLHCLSKHPGDSGDPWRDPTCPRHKAKQAIVLHPNSEGPQLQEQPLAELSSLHTSDNNTD